MFQGMLGHFNHATLVLIDLSIVLFAGFLVTRLTKALKLPNVSGFIIAGILIGPGVLGLVSSDVIEGMDFVSDIALACIAFGVGRFFRRGKVRENAGKVLVITLFESLMAGALIALVLKYVFNLSWIFALIAGAIATATAPASTMMTVRQYKARGPFVDTLLQVVALDDVVALLAFSVAAAVAQGMAGGAMDAMSVVMPIVYNLIGIASGLGCGFVLSRLLSARRSVDNRLILTVAMLLGISGLCGAFNISPLLSCMVFGACYVNITSDNDLFDQLDSFTPPVLSCFFVLSGMRLDLASLKVAGLIGVAYFLVRIVGKYLGAYLGCAVCHADRPTRNYLGVALIPQAGVSIGLAVLGQRLLPADLGGLLSTIVLSSSVLYELIGPASAKAALIWSGVIHKEERARPARPHARALKSKDAMARKLVKG